MTEATTHNFKCWLTFLLLFSIFTLAPFFIYAQSSHPDPHLSQLLDSAEILKLRGDFQKATLLCENVKTEAQEKKNWEILILALAELGDIKRDQMDLQGAREIIAYVDQLIDYYDIINYAVLAKIYLYKALFIEDSVFSKDSISILTIEQNYDQAEELVSKVDRKNKLKAIIFLRKAQFYRSHNKTNKAILYYSLTAKEIDKIDNKLNYRRALIYYNLSSFYRSLGDYERAILCAHISYYIYNHQDIVDISNALKSQVLMANYYYYNGQYSEALNHYNDIIEKDNVTQNLNFDDKRGVYTNISQPLIYHGKYDDAIDMAKYSIELNPCESRYDSIVLYFTYNNLAEAQELTGNIVDAKKSYKKSLDLRILVNGVDKATEDVFDGFLYYGLFYENSGDLDNAMNYYQKSLQILFPEFKPNNMYDNPNYSGFENKDWLLYIIFYKARTLYNLYRTTNDQKDLISSYELFLEAYKVLNEMLASDNTDEAHLALFSRFKNEFDLSIICAFELYEITSDSTCVNHAFQFIESNKYFLLVEAIANSKGNFGQGGTDSLVYIQRKINREVALLNVYLENPISEDSTFSLRNTLVQKLLEKSIVEEAINQELGNENVSVVNRSSLTIKEVQNEMLNPGEIIVNYYWTDYHLYGLLISKEYVDIVKIEIDDNLLENIKLYKAILVGADEVSYNAEDEFPKFIAASSYLYKRLVFPIMENVQLHTSKFERLIIVPDHLLANLPFESLISHDSIPEVVSYWVLPYLVNEVVISYAYSMNILKSNMEHNRQVDNPKLLGLSYSTYRDDDEDIAKLRADNELPYSAVELDKISHWIKKTDLLKGDDATEDVFKEKAKDYSLLHLAVHGIADTLDMFESRLIFKKSENTFEDGYLHAFELYDMDLSQTELAVLSACETGLGRASEGEGVFSIARGFAYAGCPSIMMSLWKVNDKATSNLMGYFYKNLAKGFPKDVALQKAKLEYISIGGDAGAHPSNWAAFISLGNNKPIQLPKRTNSVYYISIIILVIGMLLFMVIRKRSKLS